MRDQMEMEKQRNGIDTFAGAFMFGPMYGLTALGLMSTFTPAIFASLLSIAPAGALIAGSLLIGTAVGYGVVKSYRFFKEKNPNNKSSGFAITSGALLGQMMMLLLIPPLVMTSTVPPLACLILLLMAGPIIGGLVGGAISSKMKKEERAAIQPN